MRPTTVLSGCAQAEGGPSGESDQSCARISAPTVPPSLKKRRDVFDFAGKISFAVKDLTRLRGAASAVTSLKEDALPKEKTVNFFYTMRWLASKGHAWTEVAAPASDQFHAMQPTPTCARLPFQTAALH